MTAYNYKNNATDRQFQLDLIYNTSYWDLTDIHSCCLKLNLNMNRFLL